MRKWTNWMLIFVSVRANARLSRILNVVIFTPLDFSLLLATHSQSISELYEKYMKIFLWIHFSKIRHMRKAFACTTVFVCWWNKILCMQKIFLWFLLFSRSLFVIVRQSRQTTSMTSDDSAPSWEREIISPSAEKMSRKGGDNDSLKRRGCHKSEDQASERVSRCENYGNDELSFIRSRTPCPEWDEKFSCYSSAAHTLEH